MLAATIVTGCAATTGGSMADLTTASTQAAMAGLIEVRRAPGCGCCHGWEAYMRDHGYTVEGADDPDLARFKADNGVPSSAQGCHTAIIDGYVVEGHVPIEAIEDLLRQRPAIDGIALPGMPPGSPGMSGEQQAPFEILALAGGDASTFGRY